MQFLRAAARVRTPTSIVALAARPRLTIGVPAFPQLVRRTGTQPAAAATPAASLYKDQNDTWVDRHAPAPLQPYLKLMRIDRPIGTWLVLLPGWWGLAMAAEPGALPDLYYMALFALGAFAMRGAGCTVNDMWDRRFDGQVARTSMRPLASGRVSMFAALVFLGLQLAVALAVLLQLNKPTIAEGVAAVPLVAVYPAMKRITYMPQVVLGCAMNFGIPMGWTTIRGEGYATPSEAMTGLAAVAPLYLGSIAWTVVYDTIYAHQDKADDARLGLKSTALLMGARTKAVLTALSFASAAGFTYAGILNELATPYYVAVTGSLMHMLWQVRTANYEDRISLTKRFVASQWLGWMMLGGIVLGRVMQPSKRTDGPAGEASVAAAAAGASSAAAAPPATGARHLA